MRFMMLLIPQGYESAAPDALPSVEAAAKMMEYNQRLQKAGVPLACDGLLPPSAGVRISYSDGKATVTDGPFAEAKEVIGGYWIIQARSCEEAIEWFKRAPIANNDILEVRQSASFSRWHRFQSIRLTETEGPGLPSFGSVESLAYPTLRATRCKRLKNPARTIATVLLAY